MIAKRKDLGFLFIVEKTIVPPGLHKSEQVFTNCCGSGTCSIASKQVTTSNASFFSGNSSSASPLMYVTSQLVFFA